MGHNTSQGLCKTNSGLMVVVYFTTPSSDGQSLFMVDILMPMLAYRSNSLLGLDCVVLLRRPPLDGGQKP